MKTRMTPLKRAALAAHDTLSHANVLAYLDMPEDTANLLARAVLQAIREPSDVMLPDPHRTDTPIYQAVRVMEDQSVSSAVAFEAAWKAMIDAALEEG